MLGELRQRFAAVSAVAPRAYWFVWWGTLINRLGGFVVPLLTIYVTTVRKESVAASGGVIAVFGAGNVLASLVGGQMADRLGRRITMLVSLFGGAAAMLGLGFARDLTEITIMVGVVGFLGELYRPAVLAFVSDVIPSSHRVQALGLLYWAINLGFAFAAAIGGFVADLDFRILFVADALTMAIYGVIIALAVPETRPPVVPRSTSSTAPSTSPWRDRDFMIFVGINLLFVMLPMQLGSVLPAHMAWQGFAPSTFGLVMSVNGLMIILIQPLMINWIARRDAQLVMVVASLFYGAGLQAVLQNAAQTMKGAHIFGYYVKNPTEYGVVDFTPERKVISLEEKPKQPKSNYAVPGLYFYDKDVCSIAKAIKPSARGEIEITDVNRAYMERGDLSLTLFGRGTAWLDTGSPDSLLQASNFIQTVETRQGLKVGCPEEIAYRQGFINLTQLEALGRALDKTEYGRYLLDLVTEEK